jgi:putative transposase
MENRCALHTITRMRPYGSPEVLEARRGIAARLLVQGMSLTKVAAGVGASVSSVKRWSDALVAGGVPALASRPHSGPRPRLTREDCQRLLAALNEGANEWGFPTPEWTCARAQALIEQLFHVSYHVDYVGTLLHRLGWSSQLPEHRARERDEAAIARWRRVEWPGLKKEARTAS